MFLIDNPAEILSLLCVWAVPPNPVHGKWERAYFESHAWCRQHTVPPLFHVRLEVTKSVPSAHCTSYVTKYSRHWRNARANGVFAVVPKIKTFQSAFLNGTTRILKCARYAGCRKKCSSRKHGVTPHVNIEFFHAIQKVWNAGNVIETNRENNNSVWQSETSYVEHRRQCIDSHTHISNSYVSCTALSITWKHAFHSWINLLSIQVRWGWKAFLLSCMNILCINIQWAAYHAPSSHYKHMLEVRWVLKGKFIAALMKFQQREPSAAFGSHRSLLDDENILNPGLRETKQSRKLLIMSPTFLDACCTVLMRKELGSSGIVLLLSLEPSLAVQALV